MTREDIDDIINIICPKNEDFEKPCISPAYLKKELEALALEEEPSGDLKSRQAVLNQAMDFGSGTFLIPVNAVKDIPSVKPQEPKTTQMIDKSNFDINQYKTDLQSAYDCGKAEVFMNNITIEKVKDILKRSIDETTNMNEAIERTLQHIYLKGWNNAAKTEWIPVSERLPEENEWVLVTVVQGSVRYVEMMRIDKYKRMFTDNVGYYYDSVIAWMPLPEPYKAESED